MTPSLPTRSIARAMRSPISRSPLAEIVPTCKQVRASVQCLLWILQS